MAKVSRRRLAQAVAELIVNQPERQAEVFKSLAAYMIATKQTGKIDQLASDISRQLQADNQTLAVEVESARPLDSEARQAIVDYFNGSVGVSKIYLEESVNQSLISGVILKTVDKELDLSARHLLKKLASLNSGGIK